jgi:hypothetical protein
MQTDSNTLRLTLSLDAYELDTLEDALLTYQQQINKSDKAAAHLLAKIRETPSVDVEPAELHPLMAKEN